MGLFGFLKGSKSKNKFNSSATFKVYNESVVDMAQNCDSRVGNSITIIITGDNNTIEGVWLDQSIQWTTECIADFINTRDYYNKLVSNMEDLAGTADKSIKGPFGLEIPVPSLFTNTTVNTNQVFDVTNRMFSNFNQDCSQEVQNAMTFDIDGNLNYIGDVNINQVIDGMTTCYFDVQNQESVVNDLEATVKGNSDVSTSIWGWIAIAVVIAVLVIIVIVIIVAIVRATRGGSKEGQSGSEQSGSEQGGSEQGGSEQSSSEPLYMSEPISAENTYPSTPYTTY